MIKIKFCPNCGGTNIVLEAGGFSGMWRCVDCNFSSPIFPEKEIEEKDEG